MFDKLMSRLFPFLLVIGLVVGVLGLAALLGMTNAWAAPASSSSREMATDSYPVTEQGFNSFVISREVDDTFVVSGKKLGGEAVTLTVVR